jgi:4-aminobutyrate aminotransferase
MMDTAQKYEKYVVTSHAPPMPPVEVSHAQGATISAADGTTYLDGFAGYSVVNAGHSNPEVLAAAKSAMDRHIHVGSYLYYAPAVADLAEKLAAITPGRLQQSFFGNSGAEAVEGALRVAKTYTDRNEFISLQYSFHGRTLGTLSLGGNARRKRRAGPMVAGAAVAPAPYCYRCPLHLTYPSCDVACADEVERVFETQTSGNVAAMIAEPVMGEGGIIVPPPAYFPKVKRIVENNDALFISDEVQTSFGRTGSMFASEEMGIEPDILTLAKGIANGFPLSAFTTRPEIGESFQPGDHFSTFGGNLVSSAAAIATIEFLEREQIAEHTRRVGQHVLNVLEGWQDTHPLVGDVRGKGLMIGIELVSDQETRDPAPEAAKRVQEECRKAGLLIGCGGFYGNVLRFQPPLVITMAQAGRALDILDQALRSQEPGYASSVHSIAERASIS